MTKPFSVVAVEQDHDEFGIPIIAVERSSAERKRQAITDAAIAEFMSNGYAGSSVDGIADRARVSKPTIYKHFGSKERLFLNVIGGYLREKYTDLCPLGPQITQDPDPRAALIEYLGSWARIVLRADMMTLRRLVIGEVDRFPQLGHMWFAINYRNDTALMSALSELHERGTLDVPDPLGAVRQLISMTVGVPQLIKTFQPEHEFDDAELNTTISSGVDVFLSHYAKRST
ncbi:TetR/AcrR family transcriptional regulator [Nocardia sp. NPDC052566]|uniref:TetR/AcrR family transcriptional regulator n=1 Tax=Nocardia sp. NPDC052566 TaxID=3364330 RepID=UPI0037C64C87